QSSKVLTSKYSKLFNTIAFVLKLFFFTKF
ncbi:uncharacterized protein METZ01_LOCUS360969, partial [marine metagenome]